MKGVVPFEQCLRLDVLEWAQATFHRAPGEVEPILKHLQREVQEMRDSEGRDPEEFADALMILWHAAHVAGHEWHAIVAAVHRKLQVNRARTWGDPDADGVVEHVRGASP